MAKFTIYTDLVNTHEESGTKTVFTASMKLASLKVAKSDFLSVNPWRGGVNDGLL
jgi:Flp pilus assembly protein CpaB